MRRLKTTILALSFLTSYSAKATVSALSDVVIPYKTIQSDEICLMKQKMIAEFGIPLGSLMEGILEENQVRQQILGGGSFFTNINLLAEGTKISSTYISDNYTADEIWEYEFALDFAAVAALNGPSVAGRQKTIDRAKLAVISILNTAELTFGARKFRITLNLNNLPSQAGLTGNTVFPTTSFHYTSSSPVLAGYEAELLSASCPAL